METSWLYAREQPQAPIAHVLGKSVELRQHLDLVTDPPLCRHAFSFDPGVGFGGGALFTQRVPLKQLPAGHSQTFTAWLLV